MGRKKEELQKTFQIAKETHRDVILEITVPTRDAFEYIVVLNDNIDYKLDYYMNNYNDDLELIKFTEIKIMEAYVIDFDLDVLT